MPSTTGCLHVQLLAAAIVTLVCASFAADRSNNSVTVLDDISCRGGACLSLADDHFRVSFRDDLQPGSTVLGNVSSELMNVYASRYAGGLDGSVRLSVRLLDAPTTRSWSGPLVVTARNNAGGYSFSLSKLHPSASRIMCPSDVHQEATFVTVGVGTNILASVRFQYEMRLDVLNSSEWSLLTEQGRHTMKTSPDHPDVVQFLWNSQESVIIRVSSEDEHCASLVVQPNECPLVQVPGDLVTTSKIFSLVHDGTIRVIKKDYPHGFFLIALSQGDPLICSTETGTSENALSPEKIITIELVPDNQVPASLVFPFVLVFIFILLGVSNKYFRVKLAVTSITVCESNSMRECVNRQCSGISPTEPPSELRDDDLNLPGIFKPNTLFHRTAILFACALLVLAFGASTVVRHVREEVFKGHLDVCYRNERCSYTAMGIPDFNHVASNIPYIGAGIGFLLSVREHRNWYLSMTKGGSVRVGVQHDFDLLAAMGVGLLLEGFTSGLYHICPNDLNSNIDFFFIYYIYALIGAKLFQTRRGIVERFNYTPVLLVSALTMVSFSEELFGNGLLYRLMVVIFHLATVILWCIQMYLYGNVGLSQSITCFRQRSSQTLPINRRLAVAVFVLNVAIIALGLSVPSVFDDFSSYVLLFFTAHSGLYTLFYFVMKKKRHSERPPLYALVYLVLGSVLSVFGLVFFVLLRPYDTTLTPALSRSLNSECYLFGFYDAHDIWHFLSAGGLYFTFMVIMTIDDDLLAVPTEAIHVI